MNLTNYGFNPTYLSSDPQALIPARVTAVHKQRYELFCDKGPCFGQLKSSAYYYGNDLFPTVGDFVLINHQPQGDSLIEQTLIRKTYFSRLDPSSSGHNDQAVAANFDYVFILQSLNHDFNLPRLERYLALSWQSGALPVVVLTKADLQEDWQHQVSAVQAVAKLADVVPISSKTGYGIDALSNYLKPQKTLVLLGSSGVGKSSLVNRLMDNEVMAVSAIREDDSRGRHTTTHRQLFMLPRGAMVIDTPGMREIGLWDAKEGLAQTFDDIETLAEGCRFSDCGHQKEPGCAIIKALAEGSLSQSRWERYLRLEKEAKYAQSKENYLQLKAKKNKNIAQFAKTIKNHKG